MILSSIAALFNAILYQPLFNALILIYNYSPLHDFGIAIVGLTIIIRLILYPLSVKAFKSQRAMQRLQPKIQDLQKKYKDDRERQTREMMELYKSEKINPFSGLLVVIIQLPILIALYQVFRQGLAAGGLDHLYLFIHNPGHLNYMFLGLVDLAKSHNIIMAALAGILQFFQTKMMIPPTPASQKTKGDVAQMMQKQMLYVLPVMTGLIMYSLPAALSLYLIASGAFSVVQQYFILQSLKPRES